MRFFARLSSLVAGMAAAGCVHAADAQSLDAALSTLRAGGNLIIMRHATSPSNQIAAVGMTDGCVLQAGRGLNAQGFFEARFLGEWLAENHVKIDKTYTSDMCRAWDTASLVAVGGTVEPRPELKSDDPATAETFKRMLDAEFTAAPKANILLVTHSNITPLYGAGPLPGEAETPSGRVHILSAGGATMRIDANAVVSAEPAPAE